MLSLYVVGVLLSFLLAYGVGANNVANTFGVMVATKTVLRNDSSARRLGIVFEVIGALLTYFFICNAYEKKGFFDFRPCNETEKLISASVATMAGANVWLLVWTFIGYPVSVSHCLLGSALGAFTWTGCTFINWNRVAKLYFWSISVPLFSAGLSVLLYKIEIYIKNVFDENKKFITEYGHIGVTVLVNVAVVVLIPPDTIMFFVHEPVVDRKIGLFFTVFIGLVFGSIFLFYYKNRYNIKKFSDLVPNCPSPYQAVTVFRKQFRFLRMTSEENTTITTVAQSSDVKVRGGITFVQEATPRRKLREEKEPTCIEIILNRSRQILEISDSVNIDISQTMNILQQTSSDSSDESDKENEITTQTTNESDISASNEPVTSETSKDQENHTRRETFKLLLIITTVSSCVARGGHDVSNAISYLFVLKIAYEKNLSYLSSRPDIPLVILLLGLLGIILGMWTWWKPVMHTISKKLVKPVSHISGFCIEFGVVLTIIFCSHVEIPISMTYCKITTMVAVGHAAANVNYKLFIQIFAVWFLTAPVTFILGAMFHCLLIY